MNAKFDGSLMSLFKQGNQIMSFTPSLLLHQDDWQERNSSFRKSSAERLQDLRCGLNEDTWIQRVLTNPTMEMLGQQVLLGNLKYDDTNDRFVGEMPITRNMIAGFHNVCEDQSRFQHLEVQTILMEENAARLRGENFRLPTVVAFVHKNAANAIKPSFYVYRGGSTYVAALKLCKVYNRPINVPMQIYVIEDWEKESKALAEKVREYYDVDVL